MRKAKAFKEILIHYFSYLFTAADVFWSLSLCPPPPPSSFVTPSSTTDRKKRDENKQKKIERTTKMLMTWRKGRGRVRRDESYETKGKKIVKRQKAKKSVNSRREGTRRRQIPRAALQQRRIIKQARRHVIRGPGASSTH